MTEKINLDLGPFSKRCLRRMDFGVSTDMRGWHNTYCCGNGDLNFRFSTTAVAFAISLYQQTHVELHVSRCAGVGKATPSSEWRLSETERAKRQAREPSAQISIGNWKILAARRSTEPANERARRQHSSVTVTSIEVERTGKSNKTPLLAKLLPCRSCER